MVNAGSYIDIYEVWELIWKDWRAAVSTESRNEQARYDALDRDGDTLE